MLIQLGLSINHLIHILKIGEATLCILDQVPFHYIVGMIHRSYVILPYQSANLRSLMHFFLVRSPEM